MKNFFTVFISAIFFLTGCASMPSNWQSAGIGAGLGCIAGGAIATMTGGKPGVGCVIGAAGGGLIGYVKAREAEIADMKGAQAALPGSKIETQIVSVTDHTSGEKREVDTFRSLSVPLSARALTDNEGQKVFFNLGKLAQKHEALVTVTGGTPFERERAIDLIKLSGANNVIQDPALKTSVGRKTDLVIVVTPSNTSTSASV